MTGDPDEMVMLICDKCGPVGVTTEDRQEDDARDHTREAHGTDVAFREA